MFHGLLAAAATVGATFNITVGATFNATGYQSFDCTCGLVTKDSPLVSYRQCIMLQILH
jgi:hypothetical protein